MSILRNDLEVALDEAQAACAKAASVHRVVADALEDEGLADSLAGLAQRREAAARELAEELLRRHDAPHGTPHERELLTKAAIWTESLVEQDVSAILRHSLEEEKAVAAAAGQAAAAGEGDELAQRLRTLAEDARDQSETLARRLGEA